MKLRSPADNENAELDVPEQLSVLKLLTECWVAVKELKLGSYISICYYIGETLLFTIYIPILVTEFEFLSSNPECFASGHWRLHTAACAWDGYTPV